MECEEEKESGISTSQNSNASLSEQERIAGPSTVRSIEQEPVEGPSGLCKSKSPQIFDFRKNQEREYPVEGVEEGEKSSQTANNGRQYVVEDTTGKYL